MDKGETLRTILSFLERDENPDSITISTPARGGECKIYLDFSKPEEAKIKIDNALAVRAYANSKLEVK